MFLNSFESTLIKDLGLPSDLTPQWVYLLCDDISIKDVKQIADDPHGFKSKEGYLELMQKHGNDIVGSMDALENLKYDSSVDNWEDYVCCVCHNCLREWANEVLKTIRYMADQSLKQSVGSWD